ncbi:chitobiase/beta-hexosaminidase C-terminal domain-containing protein [bacterium]|nr:chitobiase/beta-hexosaminidase C-terminal domain-containing protein [bacterium]
MGIGDLNIPVNHGKAVLAAFLFSVTLSAAASDIRIISRLDYYTNEDEAELLVLNRGDTARYGLRVDVRLGSSLHSRTLSLEPGAAGSITVPIAGLGTGSHLMYCRCAGQDSIPVEVRVLPPRSNAVQIDRLSGGLIVNALPFVPFGFYTYSPVEPELPAEERTSGFTMMSPYQNIERNTRDQRRAYMDRCAELGMKVHYNLLSVAGGGGIGSARAPGRTEAQKRQLLIEEITAFKDHPALLAWYIADEPVGQYVPPERLIDTYRLIKRLDPYHPVSIVFMTPSQAFRYRDAMDIVMADPYPIPHGSVEEAGEAAARLRQAFYPGKPVWIVPQAFGGGEHWIREPTPREIRVMTMLSLIEGATGIQYFIRHGRNGFPKSTAVWHECGDLALETAWMTPFLVDFSLRPALRTSSETIHAAAWRRGNRTLVLAANSENRPEQLRIALEDTLVNTSALVLFENRRVRVAGGVIDDMIDALGTRAYVLSGDTAQAAADVENLLLNGDFENNPVAGVPAGCYVRAGRDRGATYFTDTRHPGSGDCSLSLVTPEPEGGVSVDLFPARLEPGQGYRLSLIARGYDHAGGVRLPGPSGFLKRLFSGTSSDAGPARLQVRLGVLADTTLTLSRDWREYVLRIPAIPGRESIRTGPSLSLRNRGTAWVDRLRLIADPLITTEIRGEEHALRVTLSSADTGEICYTLNGMPPDRTSTLYEGPFIVRSTPVIQAAVFDNGKQRGSSRKRVLMHQGFGCGVTYRTGYSDAYPGNGELTLTDGETAGTDFRDRRWQAFLRNDCDIIVDLGRTRTVGRVRIRFLQDIRSWIFLPERVIVSVSADGSVYTPPLEEETDIPAEETGPLIRTYSIDIPGREVRYIRIRGVSRGVCPAWHPGAGGDAWLFTDEIIID